MIIYILRK